MSEVLPIVVTLKPHLDRCNKASNYDPVTAFSTHIRGIYLTTGENSFVILPGPDNCHSVVAISVGGRMKRLTPEESKVALSKGFHVYNWRNKCRNACECCITKLTLNTDLSYLHDYVASEKDFNSSSDVSEHSEHSEHSKPEEETIPPSVDDIMREPLKHMLRQIVDLEY